jgi:hypothetical protein
MIKPTIGVSICHGTLRPKDLISAFASYLQEISTQHDALIKRADEYDLAPETSIEEEEELLTDLFCALDSLSPDGSCFGAHEGDGSDFGYWAIDDETGSL